MASVLFVWIRFIFIVIYLVNLQFIMGVYYVPQQTGFIYVNKKYVYNESASITRFGRNSTYYFNSQCGIYHKWGNNVTLHLVFFEYQQNQYKRSFFEVHLKLCDLFERDPYFGKALGIVLAKHGVTCPMLPGMYKLFNITLPSEHIPNLLPFTKGKVEFTFRQLPSNDAMATVYVTFVVKNTL